MIGNKNGRIILQPRDRELLRVLTFLRLVDREQASALAGFASKTRANARLLALTRAGILSRRFVGTINGGRRAVYHLPTKRRRGGAYTTDPAGLIHHQLALNDVYLALTRGLASLPDAELRSWQTWDTAFDPALPLIPDAYFELLLAEEIRSLFVEVDLGTEALRVWTGKAEHYLELAQSGAFQRRFGQERFRVLVVGISERRVQSIRTTIASLTTKMFWLADLSTINRDGLFSAVWLRPTGEERQSLL